LSVTNFRKVYRCFFFKSVNIWHSYKHDGGCLVHDVRLANTLLKIEKKCTTQWTYYAKYLSISKIYSLTASATNPA